MCGRFTLSSPADVIADWFQVVIPDQCVPRYNIAPTQGILTVGKVNDERATAIRRWGLIPSWAKDPDIGHRMINARSETAAEKPSFRKALEKRRCLIPASGFYEWKKTGTGKQPYLIRIANEPVFAFAGLWESWNAPEGDVWETCTILTTDANPFMKSLHHRMPVILRQDDYDAWLDPEPVTSETQSRLFEPLADVTLDAFPVSRHVNSPRNDDPSCEDRVDPEIEIPKPTPKSSPPPSDGEQGLLF